MPYNNLYLIGLTGNIACGKSTVLGMLRAHGAATIDADAVTHELQRPGQDVYRAIVAAFGAEILVEPGGPIDRRRLGAIVFADPAELRRLEQIVHPAVHAHLHAWLAERAAAEPGSVAVIDAVKLVEAGWKPLCDAVWVVTCTRAQQIERLVATRGMSVAEAERRIDAQPPQEARIAQADLVIDNSGTLAATEAQVDAAWRAFVAGRRPS
jgi:dephospho-CoA kinase